LEALALRYLLKVTLAAGLSRYGIPLSLIRLQTRFTSTRGNFPVGWLHPGSGQKPGPSWHKTSAAIAQARADQHRLDRRHPSSSGGGSSLHEATQTHTSPLLHSWWERTFHFLRGPSYLVQHQGSQQKKKGPNTTPYCSSYCC